MIGRGDVRVNSGVGYQAGSEVKAGIKPVSASICHLPVKEKNTMPSAQEVKLAELFARDGYVSGFIIVSPGSFGAYNVIANASILRAAIVANIDSIPAIVGEFDKYVGEEIKSVDEILKGKVCPVELALFYRGQIGKGESERGYAKRNRLKPTTLRNKLRLLSLDSSVLDMVRKGLVSEGQGRTIAYLEDPKEQLVVAKACVANSGISVRKLEDYVHRQLPLGELMATKVDPNIATLEKEMSSRLGGDVSVTHRKSSGELKVKYDCPQSAMDMIARSAKKEFDKYGVVLKGSVGSKGRLEIVMPNRETAVEALKLLEGFAEGVIMPGELVFNYDDLDGLDVLINRLVGAVL